MFFYVFLQCRHRTCDVGRREPSARVDGLNSARDRLRSLGKTYDFVRRAVGSRLWRALEMSMTSLM